MDIPKWISDLIDKGGSVDDCLTLWKEIQASERDERAALRELKRTEMEQTIRMRELELKDNKLEIQKSVGVVPSSNKATSKNVKLPKFLEGQDPDIFLKSFEKLAALYKWDKSEWPIRIIPLLSGKALEAYSRLNDADGGSYDKIKEAILKRYDLTAEAYREKFRTTTQEQGESFSEFKVKVERYLRHWCVRENIYDDHDKLYDMMLREQLLQNCGKELRLWVNEHKPKTAQEVVDLAESFQVAHKLEVSDTHSKPKQQASNSLGQYKGGSYRDQGRNRDSQRQSQSRNSSNMSRTCYNCHRQGHLSYDCPLKKNEKGKQGNFGLCIDKHKYIGDDNQEGKTVKLSGVAIDSDHSDKISPGLDIVKGTVEGKSHRTS